MPSRRSAMQPVRYRVYKTPRGRFLEQPRSSRKSQIVSYFKNYVLARLALSLRHILYHRHHHRQKLTFTECLLSIRNCFESFVSLFLPQKYFDPIFFCSSCMAHWQDPSYPQQWGGPTLLSGCSTVHLFDRLPLQAARVVHVFCKMAGKFGTSST